MLYFINYINCLMFRMHYAYNIWRRREVPGLRHQKFFLNHSINFNETKLIYIYIYEFILNLSEFQKTYQEILYKHYILFLKHFFFFFNGKLSHCGHMQWTLKQDVQYVYMNIYFIKYLELNTYQKLFIKIIKLYLGLYAF